MNKQSVALVGAIYKNIEIITVGAISAIGISLILRNYLLLRVFDESF